MSDAFYLDRLDQWLKAMNQDDLEEIEHKFLGDTPVHVEQYKHLYEKGLDLIKTEPCPKQLLLHILDEYTERLNDLPNFDFSLLEIDKLDDLTKEKIKTLILFGTQAALVKENARIQFNLKKINQNYRDLLGVITHEFKNSLTSIYGYNRIINKRMADGNVDQVVEITTQIDRLSQKLFQLVETLLNMSLIEQNKLHLEPKDYKLVHEVINPVVKEMEVQLGEKGMAIEVFSKENDFLVSGDLSLIQIAFRNLVMNAVQYGYENTDIEIYLKSKNGFIEVDFFNKGYGIDDERIDKIFEKFSRFHNQRQRTNVGIGLFTVKHIIELHQGSIIAESKVGEWMRFKIKLPVTFHQN